MHVCFVAYFYAPCVGGGETILRNQAEELVRRGHRVDVHTTTYTNIACTEATTPGMEVMAGVRVHRHRSALLPFKNPLEKDAVTPGFLAAAAQRPDLFVAVGYPSLHLDMLWARTRLGATPLVVANYVTADVLDSILDAEGGTWNRKLRAGLWTHWVRRQLAAAELVLADSPVATRALASRLHLTNVRTHIGMAVDPREFATLTDADRAAARAALGLGDDKILLAPSRVARQKGADLLVEAAAPLLAHGWRLVIHGPVNEPEFAAHVRSLAAPLGDRVVMGQLDRRGLLALMTTSEVVVLPSRGETVGGVVFEGMWAGCLAIVSDAVEAAREVYLRHEDNGLLVPSEDVPRLRAALHRAMTTDTAAMRAAGRAMVEAEYTWSTSVDRLEGLFEEALARRGDRVA